MNARTLVRKVVQLPARVTPNLSGLACGLRLFLAAVAFAPVAHAQVPATPAPSRPLNVILVLRDQTRYELPAAAGYHMPALDRLAQQGSPFAITISPECGAIGVSNFAQTPLGPCAYNTFFNSNRRNAQ
jgi:hypothetical protein